jgi:hypothetical protein
MSWHFSDSEERVSYDAEEEQEEEQGEEQGDEGTEEEEEDSCNVEEYDSDIEEEEKETSLRLHSAKHAESILVGTERPLRKMDGSCLRFIS